MFNVAEIATPLSLGSLLIGAEADWVSSEAQYNRHAFTYKSDVEGVDRLAVPIQTRSQNTNGEYSQKNALHLFEIDNKNNPVAAMLMQTGKVGATVAPKEAGSFYFYNNRSIFDGDVVFYILGGSVWSALWGILIT